jgi:hypothetical protein
VFLPSIVKDRMIQSVCTVHDDEFAVVGGEVVVVGDGDGDIDVLLSAEDVGDIVEDDEGCEDGDVRHAFG